MPRLDPCNRSLALTPVGKVYLDSLQDFWNGFTFWLVGLFS